MCIPFSQADPVGAAIAPKLGSVAKIIDPVGEVGRRKDKKKERQQQAEIEQQNRSFNRIE